MKSLRMGVFVASFLIVAGICTAEAAAKPSVFDRYGIAGDTAAQPCVHYSTAETGNWTVGLINTDSTIAAYQKADTESEKLIKFKNMSAAADLSTDYFRKHLAARMNKIFRNTVYESKIEPDKKYDCYAYIDLQQEIGIRSGNTTSLYLTIIFVNANNEYLGQESVCGFGVVPNPAWTAGYRDAIRDWSDDLGIFLDGGLDFVKAK
jgi:hypothetical protein